MNGRGDELPTFISRLLEWLALFHYHLNLLDMHDPAGDHHNVVAIPNEDNNWQNIDIFGIADMDEEFIDLNGENDDVLVGGADIDEFFFDDAFDLNGENDDIFAVRADINDEVFYDPFDQNGENDDIFAVGANIDDEVFYDPVDLNGENDDNIAVAGGINNDNAYEGAEEAADLHQDIPEEDPLPGVSSGSTKRSREEDVKDEAHMSKRIRFANPDPGTESDIAHEAAEEAADVHQNIPEEDPLPGVSRTRLRDPDYEGPQEKKRFRQCEFGDVDDPEDNQQVTDEMLPSGSTKRSREDNVENEAHTSNRIGLANPDPGTGPNVWNHTERSSGEPSEGAPPELDNHQVGGSRKKRKKKKNI